MRTYILNLIVLVFLSGCIMKENNNSSNATPSELISKDLIGKTITEMTGTFGSDNNFRISKGVNQVAALWRTEDGSSDEFTKFCSENFISDKVELKTVFDKLSNYFEIINGNFHKIDVGLKENLHLEIGEIDNIDKLFGGYSVSSHLNDDLYKNKIAFYVSLNFPTFNLEEKTNLSSQWTMLDWAYARMGDIFTTRVLAELYQNLSQSFTNSDNYISEYNIYMGRLIDDEGIKLFPADMKLITHWGLRDELKSNYNSENGLKKQRMIYSVMKNIISQNIPETVINTDKYDWNPDQNKLFENGDEITFTSEPDTRYVQLLNNFKAVKAIDKYDPNYPDFIKRSFDGGMEISKEDVENLFIEFISSPQVKQVAELIKKRLGRDLEPFDIWYDGFKSRSSINEEDLDKIVSAKYPDRKAFEADLFNILIKMGFTVDQAEFISAKIQVDPSRGAGHAWGAEMRDDKSRLRTRIGKDGMNYKGYNIAVHEFGHNVEQTITLHNVDYYMLHGVPNTSFTEAIAFLFQHNDLNLLGFVNKESSQTSMDVLDNFWAAYEIMGVSLVDMGVWEWLYKNENATASQLKEAVTRIATEVWNKYYSDVFGVEDQPILAIYSHMIDNPLYLSNYPMGHIIDFQIESFTHGKNMAEEITRMLRNGRLTPQVWMQRAVGNKISTKPLLDATSEALEVVKKV